MNLILFLFFFRSANGFKRLGENVQFFWYLLYGFGIPAILTSIIYIMDKIESIPKYLRPGFDESSCSLFSEKFQNITCSNRLL